MGPEGTTCEKARATRRALGKSAEAVATPECYPLKLLRGAIEQTEIIGAAVAILVGHRAAASERGRQTLALILTRPVRRWQFLAGKVAAGVLLLARGPGAVAAGCAAGLAPGPGVGGGVGGPGRAPNGWVAGRGLPGP